MTDNELLDWLTQTFPGVRFVIGEGLGVAVQHPSSPRGLQIEIEGTNFRTNPTSSSSEYKRVGRRRSFQTLAALEEYLCNFLQPPEVLHQQVIDEANRVASRTTSRPAWADSNFSWDPPNESSEGSDTASFGGRVSTKKRRVRTKIAKAVLQNGNEIVFNSEVLSQAIDTQLRFLR